VCVKTIEHNWVVELGKLAQVAKLLTFIFDVPDLNFSQDTDSPKVSFLVDILSPSRQVLGYYLKSNQNCFLACQFQLIFTNYPIIRGYVVWVITIPWSDTLGKPPTLKNKQFFLSDDEKPDGSSPA
jgi:hypothetical protein